MKLPMYAAIAVAIYFILSTNNVDAQDTLGEAIADIYVDSVVTPSTRLEIERLLNNSEATIDHQTRPDVVEERIRGAMGNQKLEQMLENDRKAHQ